MTAAAKRVSSAKLLTQLAAPGIPTVGQSGVGGSRKIPCRTGAVAKIEVVMDGQQPSGPMSFLDSPELAAAAASSALGKRGGTKRKSQVRA